MVCCTKTWYSDNIHKQNRNRCIDTESRLMVARGEDRLGAWVKKVKELKIDNYKIVMGI